MYSSLDIHRSHETEKGASSLVHLFHSIGLMIRNRGTQKYTFSGTSYPMELRTTSDSCITSPHSFSFLFYLLSSSPAPNSSRAPKNDHPPPHRPLGSLSLLRGPLCHLTINLLCRRKRWSLHGQQHWFSKLYRWLHFSLQQCGGLLSKKDGLVPV